MPGRPRTEIGTYGEIRSCRLPSGSYQALSRYRDWDGAIRRITATGSTRASAKAALWSKLADRDDFDDLGESVTPDTTFAKLAALWLEDLDLDVQLSRGTKETYAQEVRNLLMPPETRH